MYRKTAGSKKQHARPAPRNGYRLQVVFIWAVFSLGILPFLLTLLVTTQGSKGARTDVLGKIPLIGSYCEDMEKWYAEHIEPVQELRPLATLPVSWEGRWFDVDKNYVRFESWFADSLGLRDLMIRSKNELDYRLFKSSSRVYFGMDDDIYGRDLVDRELPATEMILNTPEKIDAIYRGIVKYSDKLKAQGVTVLFITPMQKQYFYPGRLPFFATHMPESTNFMALYRRMKSDPTLNFIDVFDILKSNQELFPIFYRQDFHWTDMAALAVARETTNRIALLENSTTRWQYPIEFEYRSFIGSDARFSARLFAQGDGLEPQLKKTWTWNGVHLVRPLDAKQTGIELESDILSNFNLLPSTCMYGNSFSDGMVRAGLFDYFQRFTTLDRSRSVQKIPELIKGRCKYLIVQVLDLSTPIWLSFKQ